ncbi:MAG: glycosyltransferase [Deltaproteobacteria bacterium]|nr:glycosyltransferase [Deltaproteobacteria bacterium]
MRVVVDLEAFPASAGCPNDIDQYSAALVESMVSHAGHHQIEVIISHSSEELVEDLQSRFPALFRKGAFHVSRVPFLEADQADTDWRRSAAELVREHALLQLKPDIILRAPITAPARALLISQLRQLNVPTAVALSLLPSPSGLHMRERIGTGLAVSPNGGRVKPHWQCEPELVLTASESRKRLLVSALDIPPGRITVVPLGVDRPSGLALSKAQALALRKRFSIPDDFILVITGGSSHAIERVLEAYGLLPRDLRQGNRLVIAGPTGRNANCFFQIARASGLGDGELMVAGDATDDEVAVLCDSCKLVLLSGSEGRAAQHAAQAMSCGTPVVGPDHAPIRAILGPGDALFDPTSARLASEKIYDALTSPGFREKLKLDGSEQASRFYRQECARRSFEALAQSHESRLAEPKPLAFPAKRRRMAYVSPVPPERSGIADYSAELLPELAEYYDITLITDLSDIADPFLAQKFRRLSFKEFEKSARDYDRILYHIGNSPFHVQIPSLLERHPGTLVLHDFFLSHLFNKLESMDGVSLWRNLYLSHGYPGLMARVREGSEAALWAHPCNLALLQHAAGIVVHSEHVVHMARQWFGISAEGWTVIPQLRRIPGAVNRQEARKALGIPGDAFLVCSFGFLSEAKFNDLVFQSWLGASLSRQPDCRLVFVGGDGAGRPYKDNVFPSSHIRATGYVSKEEYELYLAGADVGVQLRSELSRGETPRSVLDCMAHGMATVVSAHPSLIDLPSDCVLRTSATGSEQELIAALERLYREPGYRAELGRRAQEYVKATRTPAVIARQYAEAVEEAASNHPVSLTDRIVLKTAKLVANGSPSNEELATIATCIAESSRVAAIRQLFVDVSILVAVGDYRTGIQRVTRAILAYLLENPPGGYRVEPVFRRHMDTYRYARRFVGNYLGLKGLNLEDAPVAVNPGDVFLGLDWDAGIAIDDRAANWLLHHRQRGMRTVFTIYDLLPLHHPEWFKPDMQSVFPGWLSRICRLADSFACISRAVADDLVEWLDQHSALATRACDIGYFQLGSDIESSWASRGLSLDDHKLLDNLKGREVLLMVGTVEPRKGHGQALSALEHLWTAGESVSLVICGHEGWMVDSIAKRLRSHPELGRRLFWLEQASDEVLLQLYSTASALLMASQGEGFGLPLVEAARHALPIITRDLPVFREVVGEDAFYFPSGDSTELAQALRRWLELYRRGQHPTPSVPPTWEQSTQELLQITLAGTAYKHWQGSTTLDAGHLARNAEECGNGTAPHLFQGSSAPYPAFHEVAADHSKSL